MFSQN